jgi:hypothetical protein
MCFGPRTPCHISGVLGSRTCDGRAVVWSGVAVHRHTLTCWMLASNLLPTNWQQQTRRVSTEAIKSTERIRVQYNTCCSYEQTYSRWDTHVFVCLFVTPLDIVCYSASCFAIWLTLMFMWLICRCIYRWTLLFILPVVDGIESHIFWLLNIYTNRLWSSGLCCLVVS